MRPLLISMGLVGLSLACVPRAAPRRSVTTELRVTFTPVADSFRAAAAEYDSLWRSDGARMTRSLEAAARLSFADIGDTVIRVMVLERASQSGYRDKPMELRASYPLATK